MVAQIDKKYITIRPWKIIPRLISYAMFEGRPLTTKGQWINPILFRLFDLQKNIPTVKSVNKPVFIVGTGRSGTTILGVILSIHHDIGFLNEPKALWHSIYPCEDIIGSYTKRKAYYRLDEKHVSQTIIQNAHRILGLYLNLTGSKRLVDKYPEMIFRVPFIKKIFPDAKFIFLVRNGWNTCSSIQNWSLRKGLFKRRITHNWWGDNNRKWNLLVDQIIAKDNYFAAKMQYIKSLSHDSDMAVVEWIATMREGLTNSQLFPEDIKMFRFEDMTYNPLVFFNKLFKFCELETDFKLIEYAQKTLKPVKSYSKTSFHPEIHPLFEETMISLGYDL